MGRTRAQEPQKTDDQQLAEIASAIAAALAGGAGTVAPATAAATLSAAILSALPLVAFLGSLRLAEVVAREVADFVVSQELPEIGDEGLLGFFAELRYHELVWRAAYIRAAASRLAFSLKDVGNIQQAIAAWKAKEQYYFQLHVDAIARRSRRAQELSSAIAEFGEVLGWYATIRPTNRPHHRAAHRHNWRPLLGPPLQTGAYPGVLPFCLCEAGPPLPGAPEIR